MGVAAGLRAREEEVFLGVGITSETLTKFESRRVYHIQTVD